MRSIRNIAQVASFKRRFGIRLHCVHLSRLGFQLLKITVNTCFYVLPDVVEEEGIITIMEALRTKERYRQIVGFTLFDKRIIRMADYHAALQIHLSMPATRLRVARLRATRSPVALPSEAPCSFSTHCRSQVSPLPALGFKLAIKPGRDRPDRSAAQSMHPVDRIMNPPRLSIL